MQKIETLFCRVDQSPLVTQEVTIGCEWVLRGEGTATEKYDGTCCAVIGGVLHKRHALKMGKAMPEGWIHWSGREEQKSGHGWSPVSMANSSDQYHLEASSTAGPMVDGTYELVGPKIQRNPYNLNYHQLWLHGRRNLYVVERSFAMLRSYLEMNLIEGIVFHSDVHGMVKIKRRDFGYAWPVKVESEGRTHETITETQKT